MHDLIPLFDDHSHTMVNELLRKALCCTDCGARNHAFIAKTERVVHNPRYVVTCGECKYQGPFGRGLEDAVRQWNKPPGFLAMLIKKWKKPKRKTQFHKPSQTKTGAA